MLTQPNPVGNRRRAVPLNLSHAPPITDPSSPLRIMELYEQNVTDPAAAWVSEKLRQPESCGGAGRVAPDDRNIGRCPCRLTREHTH